MATAKKTTKKVPVKPAAKPKIVVAKKSAPKPKLVERLIRRADAYMAKRPHRSFKRTRWANRRLGGQPVASLRNLVFGTFKVIWEEKRIILGLSALYAVVSFLLLGAISQQDFTDLKDAVVQVFQGQVGAIGNALELFNSTLSGMLNQPLSQLQQFLGYFLGFLLWLATVWALRMRMAKEKITIRDALYNSTSPLISTLVVTAAGVAQVLPGAIAVALLVLAQQTGSLVGVVEYVLFGAAAILLVMLSLYWIVSTLLAMVIVTLPGMYPWQALSNASVLVIGQRWKIVLRLVVLTAVLALLWAVVLIPVLLLDGWLRFDWLPLVPVAVQALTAFTLTYFAVYAYRLYRSLL